MSVTPELLSIQLYNRGAVAGVASVAEVAMVAAVAAVAVASVATARSVGVVVSTLHEVAM